MELSWSLLEELGGPQAAFLPELDHKTDTSVILPYWEDSLLNPKNRIDTLDPQPGPKWRIDGFGLAGRQVFATPIFLGADLYPLRVDIFLPDQTEIPEHLRHSLECSEAADTIGENTPKLAISRFLVRALQNWSDNQPTFKRMYNELPFGSKIVLERIAPSVREIKINIFAAFDLERQLLSTKSLQSLWDLPESSLPPTVNLAKVRLILQLNETISLVQVPHLHGTRFFAMKSQTVQPKYLYHELKLLLTIPPHPNIMPPPLYLLTKKCAFGGKNGICGFLLEYHSQGTLHDILVSSTFTTTYNFSDQLSWSKAIISSLIHLTEKAGIYYPDLKPDNILLVPSSSSHLEPLLLDFEQRGNGTNWAAPPILNTQYLSELASSPSQHIPSYLRTHYASLLEKYTKRYIYPADSHHLKPENERKYTNPKHGYNIPWLALSTQQREAALVFNLGKLLWCMFEGIPYPNRGIWVKSEYYASIPYEFPTMRSENCEKVRHLIELCMRGWEWEPKRKNQGLTRRGAYILPQELESHLETIREEQVRTSARSYWKEEISGIDEFFEMRLGRHISLGEGADGMVEHASLREVLVALESI